MSECRCVLFLCDKKERTPYVSAEEVIANYKANPSNYYGMLIGIDEEQFDYVNQLLNSINNQQISQIRPAFVRAAFILRKTS